MTGHDKHAITQRELRNDSAIAEIMPLRRRTFVPIDQALGMFAHEAAIDEKRLFNDVDTGVDQRPSHG
jgi:hypothetical protein